MDVIESLKDAEAAIELHELSELLKILRSNDVHSFQGGGITVVFNEKPEGFITPTEAAKTEDDGHSTSTKRVSGFRDEALWRHQNGKVINFNGEWV